MAVFVYSTGSAQKVTLTPATISVSINNRTTSAQSYRVILWDTSAGVKTAITDTGVVAIAANATAVVPLAIAALATTTGFEVEIRLSNPHMAPWAALTYTSALTALAILNSVYAGDLFFDESQTETP